jgi:single-strand DNA-binding protein
MGTKGGKKLAVLSVATSERWKRNNGDWAEKTYWRRVAVFPGPKVERIEAQVQNGTRVRLAGQVRPSSYDDATGVTRYTVELVVGPFGDVEILARAKPRKEDAQPIEVAQPRGVGRGKTAAADELEAAT